ncbi:MAG TPA: hypothetical protein DCZ03_00830 [Gammaproteobacteria bacterium]|nr:hypothetical protein [Gammaproteobacteria bacterium]
MDVNKVMVSNVASCRHDTKLESIALMMWDNDCGCIPVVDSENKLIGIVTDRDIAMGAALQHKPLWEMTAQSICGEREVYCCKTRDDIHRALKLMQVHEVRRLPVVDSQNKLVGIISMGDVLASAEPAKDAALPLYELAAMLHAVSAHHTVPKLSASA